MVVSVEPVSPWTQKTAAAPVVAANPPPAQSSPSTSPQAARPPPVPAPPKVCLILCFLGFCTLIFVSKLSPRRLPPAPPKQVEEVLVPLPPVSIVGNADSLTIGHVFCVLSDLKNVSCDAWLVPSSRDFVPEQSAIFSKTARARQYAGLYLLPLLFFFVFFVNLIQALLHLASSISEQRMQ